MIECKITGHSANQGAGCAVGGKASLYTGYVQPDQPGMSKLLNWRRQQSLSHRLIKDDELIECVFVALLS